MIVVICLHEGEGEWESAQKEFIQLLSFMNFLLPLKKFPQDFCLETSLLPLVFCVFSQIHIVFIIALYLMYFKCVHSF